MFKRGRIEVRVHQDLEDALTCKAEKLQISKSEYVRMILTEALMNE